MGGATWGAPVDGYGVGGHDDAAVAARGALARAEDELDRARTLLAGAADVRWVSVAADAYRREVDVHLRVLDTVRRALDDARGSVLTHLAAAARAEAAAVLGCGR